MPYHAEKAERANTPRRSTHETKACPSHDAGVTSPKPTVVTATIRKYIACGTEANVFVTSEMTHSEVLEANAQGAIVLLTGQSVIERAYLRMLRHDLQDEFIDSDWNVKVACSQVDVSPLAIV